jgi:hypothetical protein
MNSASTTFATQRTRRGRARTYTPHGTTSRSMAHLRHPLGTNSILLVQHYLFNFYLYQSIEAILGSQRTGSTHTRRSSNFLPPLRESNPQPAHQWSEGWLHNGTQLGSELLEIAPPLTFRAKNGGRISHSRSCDVGIRTQRLAPTTTK